MKKNAVYFFAQAFPLAIYALYVYISYMKEQISIEMLKERIRARIKKLGEGGLLISGTLVRTSRRCGNPNCRCATGEKHPGHILTSKVKGKTKAVYVPVDMVEEVRAWTLECKRVKRLLKEVDALAEQIIRKHVAARRAASKNLKG